MSEPVATGERLRLEWRPFAFSLADPLGTAGGRLEHKRGWLLRLQAESGAVGWGEAAPLEPDQGALETAITALGRAPQRSALEQRLPQLPPALGFALGAALAEADGVVGAAAGGWPPAPPSAWLLPAGEAALAALERCLLDQQADTSSGPPLAVKPLAVKQLSVNPLTVKWKVAVAGDGLERRLLEALLERLPPQARLRLDANGGWDRATAAAWAHRLAAEPRLQWLEQPLAAVDQEGLEQLAQRVPVALDESLRERPDLRRSWRGWQVRRPSQEGDPRLLLAQLQALEPLRMLSTGFETGIGHRWLALLAAIQMAGPTPAAPGLAPGWRPGGPLFSEDPLEVWQAALEA